MKFSVLVAVLADDMEDKAIDTARKAGAGAATIFNARGLAADSKKTFFGLTYEGAQSVILFMLERKLSVKVLKRLQRELDLDNDDRGIAFCIPVEHLAGIGSMEVDQFTREIEDDI